MPTAQTLLDGIRQQLDLTDYKKLNWEGSFDDYLQIVLDQPAATRTAFQRLYDMVLSHGTEDIYENKDKLTRYKFFTEFATRARRRHLRPGPAAHATGEHLQECRPRLRHRTAGDPAPRPGGQSAKSTIARLLKRGLEEYSRTDAGALYSFSWKNADGTWAKDPMHSEPLQLIPEEHRGQLLAQINEQAAKPTSTR